MWSSVAEPDAVVVGAVEDAALRVDADVVEVGADDHDLAAQVGVAAVHAAERVAPGRVRLEAAVDLHLDAGAGLERATRVARVARGLEVVERPALLRQDAVGERGGHPQRGQRVAVELLLDGPGDRGLALGDQEPDRAVVGGVGRLPADLSLDRELRVAGGRRAAQREDDLALDVEPVVVVPGTVLGRDAVADEHHLGLDGPGAGVDEIDVVLAVLGLGAVDGQADGALDGGRAEVEALEVDPVAVHRVDAELAELALHPLLREAPALEAGLPPLHRVGGDDLRVLEDLRAGEAGQGIVVLGERRAAAETEHDRGGDREEGDAAHGAAPFREAPFTGTAGEVLWRKACGRRPPLARRDPAPSPPPSVEAGGSPSSAASSPGSGDADTPRTRREAPPRSASGPWQSRPPRSARPAPRSRSASRGTSWSPAARTARSPWRLRARDGASHRRPGSGSVTWPRRAGGPSR